MIQAFQQVAVHPAPRPASPLSILFAGYSLTVPSHRMGPQKLDYVLIHTVIEGKGWFKCGDAHYDLEKGDTFVILPDELHTYQADEADPWRYRWVAFRGPEADRWLAAAGLTPEMPIVRGAAEESLRAMEAIELAFQGSEWTAEWIGEGWLRLAMAAWAKAYRPEGPPAGGGRQGNAAREADRAARWLQAQQSTGSVTIARMAQELGYHRAYLTKLFRQEIGVSPIVYLQQLRIERAKQLLAEPLSVEEVALSVGYNDPLYFSKSFKKHVGCTPSEYRRGLQG